MRFSICLVDYEGSFAHFLYDICKYICYGIESAGYDCCISKSRLDPDRINILVGSHHLADPGLVEKIKNTGKYVLFQTEIITGDTINNWPVQKAFSEVQLPLMRNATSIWTGAVSKARLQEMGIQSEIFTMGYHPAMEEIQPKRNKDIDFLFCGSITPHRKMLLEALTARGSTVVTLFDDAAMYRNDLIARTRVNLAPNQGPGMNHFSGSRVLYLINNRSIVVVERCHDQAMYEHCFPSADTSRWVNLCMETLRRPDLAQITEDYYERFKKIRMVDMIEPLIDKLRPPSGVKAFVMREPQKHTDRVDSHNSATKNIEQAMPTQSPHVAMAEGVAHQPAGNDQMNDVENDCDMRRSIAHDDGHKPAEKKGAKELDELLKFIKITEAVKTQTEEQSSRAQNYFEEGNALLKKGDFEKSVKAFQAAIQLSPHNASGCFLNMGYAFKQRGRIDEAILCYEKAVLLQPGYVDAYCNLGNAYKDKGELTRAIGCYEKALALYPADADSLYNLGNIFREQGKFDEAIDYYRKALKIRNDHLDAQSNLCVVLKDKGDLKEAEKCCRKLIKRAPEFPEARWNLALIQLLAGKLREGWEGYEWRWKKQGFAEAHRTFPRPLWTGSAIDGRTILIHTEQGYGDAIQFIRYVPMLAERGAHVIVECPRELKSLMATVEGISKVFTRGETLPDFDVHCPIMSLPGAFATTLETIPASIPYIASDLSVFNKWREKIQDDRNANLKVGIAWAGSPAHKNDKNRSCPFDQLLPLFSLKNITFYSLQKKDGRHSPAPNKNIDNFIDYTGEIHDFLDTAGFIQNLDVVISVDTAAAHLAGALGKEVWTLLPFAPEWRWMLKRKDTPWYPTMKLFRQDRFGNWQGVIEEVKNELEYLSASIAEKEQEAAEINSRAEAIAKKPFVPGLTSIILHGLRNLKHLRSCLERLKNNTPEPFEVIFADNNCPAEIRTWLKKKIRAAHHYTHVASSNPGLAHAINRGIRASSGEYIVLLSADVMVSGHWLLDLIECLNRTPTAGMVGPMMNADRGIQKVGNTDYKGLEQLSAFSGKFRENYRHRRIPARTVSDYCLMFKREMIDQVGFFDENPFFGPYAFEDYCFRAQMEGYTNYLCGDVYVHISCGADRPEEGSRKAFQEKWNVVDKENQLADKISKQMRLEAADRLVLQGKTDQAIDTLIQSIGQLPCVRDLYYSLAELLLENKRYLDAIGALKAMPADETDARRYEIIGYCEEGLGLDHDAEQSADRALSLAESARAYNLKGVLSFKRGNLENAETCFKKAMDCDPGYGEPYTNTGVLRWSMGQKHEGLEWMEKGFILSPQTSDGSDRYYSALMDLGQYERGETILRGAKNVYPSKKIVFLLIDSLLKQDKFNEAMAEAEDAIISFGLEEGMLEAALEIRSKIGPKTVEKGNKRPSLSLCMIVKNEEESLAQCLSSVKHIVDELIVVDTGSSDLTKEIARAYGAKLYDYEWTNSFADARNYSLDQAQGDWVLLLDGDEVISKLDHDAIRKIVSVNDQNKAFAITTRNYLDQVAIEGWTPNDDRYYLEAAGCGWLPSEKVRIFPNHKSIRFENPVHEFVESSLAKTGIEVRRSSVPIHHYGKLKQEKMQAKKETYYQLGIKKLDEKGNDLKSLIEIAIQAAEAGKHEDALMWWRKVIEINPDESAAYYNMGAIYLFLKRYSEAIDASKISIELDPHRKEAVTNLAFGEIIGGDMRNAIQILEGLLNSKAESPIATGLLAIAYCMDDRADSGLKHLASLKKRNYRLTPVLLDTSKRLVDAGRNDYAIRLLKAIIEGGYADYELVNQYSECVKRCT
jgi:tetratricopeptide (TPR) repeat protein